MENVEWLAGGLIRWLSRSICNSKSVRIYFSQISHKSSHPIQNILSNTNNQYTKQLNSILLQVLYEHLPSGSIENKNERVWELVGEVMEFLYRHRVVTSIPVQIGRVILESIASCSTSSQISIATRIYNVLTLMFQPGLEENAKLFECLAKRRSDLPDNSCDLILAIVNGQDRLVRQHGNPRKCFVATTRREFLASLIRVWSTSSKESLRDGISTLFSSSLMHRDVLDGYSSACAASDLFRKKKKDKSEKNEKKTRSFQRKLFETLRVLCENDESMKCVLPTLLRLACTAYEENIDDDGKFFQVTLYLEFASIASTNHEIQSKLLNSFLSTSPASASMLRRSDKTAELTRKAFEPFCVSAVKAVRGVRARSARISIISLTSNGTLLSQVLGQTNSLA